MIKNKSFYVLSNLFIFSIAFCAVDNRALLLDRVSGGIFGGLIGDALGRPTEFIKTPSAIFKQFPGGIKSFADLKKFNLCWLNPKSNTLFAPYTDDTAMVLITLNILLESRKNNWDLDATMEKLAIAYVNDLDSPTGWAMPARAPGNACLKSIKKLSDILKQSEVKSKDWWQAGDKNAAGCGAVMRAHAFGIVFADNPKKAAIWAAEHSKITHGHEISQAACAAMAIGTAYAIQGRDLEVIIEQMIAWAKKYDPVTERFNEYTKKIEKSCWQKIEDAVVLARNTNQNTNVLEQHDLVFGASNIELNKIFKKSDANKIFYTYEGWAADDAIGATIYILVTSPNNVNNAILLGVHTPGDSDSIASMAGALVGARVGLKKITKDHDIKVYEGSALLEQYASQTVFFLDAANCLTIHYGLPETHTRPHVNCYWVELDRLLAGEYPGLKNNIDQKKLDLYLDAGITSFIDLTETHELVPYEQALYKKAQDRGIKVNYVRMPIKDMAIPSVETMDKIINTIKVELEAGHKVYVHCWGGIGRTGTVIGCYLVSQGIIGMRALAYLERLWMQVEKSKIYPLSPQTNAQRDFVINYDYYANK